ncbi:MAG: hypothetical protein ACRDS0_03735 [Pseudonocardiaceae bacterium]
MATSDHNDETETFSDGTPLPEEPAATGGKGPTPAQILVQMAEDDYRLIRADDGRTYAVPRNGPNIAIPLSSRSGSGVRARLAASLRRRTGQVASGSALSDCVNVLEGEASEQDPQPVYLRMARHTDQDGQPSVVVDLGTETGQAITITPDGWRIDAQAPVIFRRSELTHPLVDPVPDGSLDGLRALINLSEEDYRLAIGWVVAAYLTDMPHPILFIQGEQGSAKSNLIRSLLSVLDPQPAADRTPPGSQREWAIFARASWGFSFDNVTEIPEWLSNSLCKGVTGDAVLQRALHSDEDIVVFSFQRVIAMTTIGIKHALAGDLVDRLLLIEPDVIDQRMSEEDLRAARAAVLPHALGAVLDLVAGVLQVLPGIRVTDLPRMADFARVLAALDQVTGWDTLATYRAKIADMSMTLIEGNAFAQALYRLLTTPTYDGSAPPERWEGTAAELLSALQEICRRANIAIAELPENVQALGVRLSQVSPSLRKVGIDIRRGARSGRRRPLIIRRVRDDEPAA